MADRSMETPKGIRENVLVKISNFMFPVDLVVLDIMEDENVPIILGRPMLTTTHANIDVYGKNISLGDGNDHVWDFKNYLSPEYGTQYIISLSPSELAKDKEDFSMTLCDPDKRMSIGLEELVDIDDMWDDLDPGILSNERAKTEFLKSGGINMVGLAKNLHVFIGNHQFLVDFIILENISEFVEKGLTKVLFGQPFKEQIGLVEDRGKGTLWFKIVNDENKKKGIHEPEKKKIKEFYRGCLSLGNEYKYDQEVVDWIRGCIDDGMMIHQLRGNYRGRLDSKLCGNLAESVAVMA
ncbi:homeodomain-like protein [Tanacetum coccineum]